MTTASTGEEALQKVESEVPDLVLLDMVLPGKSGLEVCKILKSQSRTKLTPVIMFTVLGREIDRKLSAEAGADGHFIKPFTHEDLLKEIKGHLDRARPEKFSRQLGHEHSELQGRKIILEFDPSTSYERLARDFALECAYHSEAVHVLTRRESLIQRALENDLGVELIDLTPHTMLSSILQDHPQGSISLIYDSVTDLALSVGPEAAYNSLRNMLQLLHGPRMTALFLLNTSPHDPREGSSLRGLFSSQVAYGKQGITSVKLA